MENKTAKSEKFSDETSPLLTSPNPNQKCPICLDEFITEKDSFILVCGHNFHTNCLRNYVNTQMLEYGKFETIQCPQIDCKQIIDESFIKQILTEQEFNNFIKYKQSHQHKLFIFFFLFVCFFNTKNYFANSQHFVKKRYCKNKNKKK